MARTAEQTDQWILLLYLYAASECIGGLAAPYSGEAVLLAAMLLARCAVEHLTHVVWMLGYSAGGRWRIG